MSGVTKFRDSWRCRDLLTNGVVLIAVFLIHRSIKCHLTDFRGDLQFDLLISNDYVCTKLNGLAFFYGELNSVLILRLQANLSSRH